jgi:hypothetical protein
MDLNSKNHLPFTLFYRLLNHKNHFSADFTVFGKKNPIKLPTLKSRYLMDFYPAALWWSKLYSILKLCSALKSIEDHESLKYPRQK